MLFRLDFILQYMHLPKKVPGNIRELHGLLSDLGVVT